jgi:hypothetical protein
LRALSDQYKRVAGYNIEQIDGAKSASPRKLVDLDCRLAANLRAPKMGAIAVQG